MKFNSLIAAILNHRFRLRLMGFVVCGLVVIALLRTGEESRKVPLQNVAETSPARSFEAAGHLPPPEKLSESTTDAAKFNTNNDEEVRITLEFDGGDVHLGYHLGTVGKAWSKGETVKPGFVSYWTGWTYPALRALGEGEHTVPYQKDTLSQEQRYTLLIEPKIKMGRP